VVVHKKRESARICVDEIVHGASLCHVGEIAVLCQQALTNLFAQIYLEEFSDVFTGCTSNITAVFSGFGRYRWNLTPPTFHRKCAISKCFFLISFRCHLGDSQVSNKC